MENIKTRTWCMVLYPEDSTHSNCISILSQSGYDFAYILHDKDLWEENESTEHIVGEPKKEHWHVVLKLKNPRYRNAVAQELGIAPNYLEPCRDLKKALLYLVHDGYEAKFQYDVSEVVGTLRLQLETALMCDNECERVLELVHIIDSMSYNCKYREVLVKACEAGLWSEFRKLGTGIKYLIDEHNSDYENIYSNGSKPTVGAYEDAKSLARFEGFVQGHVEGTKDRLAEYVNRSKK